MENIENNKEVLIDLTHRLYYDPDLEMVTIEDIKASYKRIHLSETAVLKMLDYMLIHGMKSNIRRDTVISEIQYRNKVQEKKDRLDAYIKERISKEYYEDIPNRCFINIHTKEKVNAKEIREKLLREIEYVSKLL